MSQSAQEHRQAAPKALAFRVLTISDTRNLENDKSGKLIVERMEAGGFESLGRQIVPDEPGEIQAAVREMLQDPKLDVVLTTGGTGISPRDRTPEALEPMFDVPIPGFGEMFRVLSYDEIGPATMLSRATAGRIGSVLVFALPGSSNAVELAMDTLLVPELPHLVHHSRG
ncbi:MAG: MogA/MoaB family molybdenum cofactor biosynthesis protein [Planctomycetota bacterium]